MKSESKTQAVVGTLCGALFIAGLLLVGVVSKLLDEQVELKEQAFALRVQLWQVQETNNKNVTCPNCGMTWWRTPAADAGEGRER